MVVFEVGVPAGTFVLDEALGAFPDVVVEFERLVPTNHEPLPYLWATDEWTPAFSDALTDAPAVDRLQRTTTFEDGVLHHIEWNLDGDGLFQWVAECRNDAALIQATGSDDEWILKFRFPDRASLADFRAAADELGVDLRVVRLYDLDEPKLGQYNLTKKQRDALVRALEMGHFEVPRGATLEEVAESLDISPKAVSERLRRGQTNLVTNSLVIGRPVGVGLDGQ